MQELRQQVKAGFKKQGDLVFYSHVLPFQYSNFIDGMAWIGVLAKACEIAGDEEIRGLAWNHVRLLEYYQVRNIAPIKPRNSWIEVDEGLYGHPKEQSLAGPFAAMYCGVVKENESAIRQANWLVRLAPLYAFFVRFGPMKQHLNTVMFAHLLLGKKPPKRMAWVCEDNMIYSYIYGKQCEANYPNTGPWPAKDIPFSREEKAQKYTPVCDLAGRYLQGIK